MADCEQWLIAARADCEDCEWFVEARNAQGIAAQHADQYGHTVACDLNYGFRAEPESPTDHDARRE